MAFGSLMALSLCAGISEDERKSIEELMHDLSLEVRCKKMDFESVFSAMKKDKKQNKDHLQFILLHHLCSPYIDEALEKETLEQAFYRFVED